MALVKRGGGQTESESKLWPLLTFIIKLMTSKAQLFPTLPSRTNLDAQKSSVKIDMSESTDMSYAIFIKYLLTTFISIRWMAKDSFVIPKMFR